MNVFIAGPRAIRSLNQKVKQRIDKIMENNLTILVGDAAGIDKQIQMYCYSSGYHKVKVFSANGKVRNNIGKWDVKSIQVPPNIRGFEFYATKDLAMAKEADYGFMIWNGKSKGTYNNMINLVKYNKKILLYMIPDKQFYVLHTMQKVHEIKNGLETRTKTKTLVNDENASDIKQLSLFY